MGGMWRQVCGRVRLVGTDLAVEHEEHTVAGHQGCPGMAAGVSLRCGASERICPTDGFMHEVNREIVDLQKQRNY